MSTIQHDDVLADSTLTATEREWLERQGRAARALAERQRKAASESARSAAKLRDDRLRRASLPQQR